MNIQSISVTPYNYQNKSKPSFGAIHPTRYFEMVDENTYRQIVDADLIKNTLQKKIVTWLNHDYNARMKLRNGSTVKSKPETPATKAIRERITRFFINNDSDYRKFGQDRASSYFNTNMNTGVMHSYLFTGESVNVLDVQAENIKNVQSQIKRLASDMQGYYGFKYDDAKARASKELEFDLAKAKSDYHEAVLSLLRDPKEKANPKNTVFNAFFLPITKGKKTTYELVNATFEPRLV
jgi:hypothetical protein